MTVEWWFLAVVCSGVIIAGTWWASKWTSRNEAFEVRGGMLYPLLGGALLLRLILAATTKGYGPDIGTFSAWAGHAAEGLFSFYSPGYFADYPPGYIYVLWLIGKVRGILGIDFGTPAFLMLLKLPAMLSDIAVTWLILRLGQRYGNFAMALALAALYAFNPAVILNSAVWGQVDGILSLFILLGICLLETNPAGSAASFSLALLIKPQALIFAPLPILWYAVRLLRREKNVVGDILLFTGTAMAVFSLVVFPFAMNQHPVWIVTKYGSTLASYPFASLNAFNLFALTGGNLIPAGNSFLFLSYTVWGYVFICLIVIFAALLAFRGKLPDRFAYIPLFLSAAVFVLSAKMHERYLFPALALVLLFHMASRERWGLLLFAGFSATQFLNALEVLALSHMEIYAVPSQDPLLLVVSLANVLLFLLLVRIGCRRYLESPPAA